jgi:hypothetical protein
MEADSARTSISAGLGRFDPHWVCGADMGWSKNRQKISMIKK